MAAGSDMAMPSQDILDGHAANYDRWLDRAGGPRDPDGCIEWAAALRMLQRRGISFSN